MRQVTIAAILALALVAAFIFFSTVHRLHDAPLIESFAAGRQSPELFELPNGVNEFDLLHIDGVYYLASDNKTETELRSAKSITDLANATASIPIPDGRYPTIQYSQGIWHLWVWFGEKMITQHFTSSHFEGPYALADTLPYGLADIHVRKAHNGRYFAAYKDLRDGAQLAAGLLTASSLDGPWDDLGHIFADRAGWHAGEEADPALFENNGKLYLSFAGWDGHDLTKNQKIGIVEINPTNGKAIGEATILLEANKPWHTRNGHSNLFNPVFLCDGARSLLFYAQNASAKDVPSGWGYIEAGIKCN